MNVMIGYQINENYEFPHFVKLTRWVYLRVHSDEIDGGGRKLERLAAGSRIAFVLI